MTLGNGRNNGNCLPCEQCPLRRQPALREFSAANLYKAYDLPYHPGALKYFKEHNIQAKALQ